MCNHKSCHQRLKCRGKVAGGHLPYWNKLILGNILPHQDELLLNGNHSTWKIHLFSRQCWLCITAPIMMVWNLIHLCDLLVFVGWFVWWPTVWLCEFCWWKHSRRPGFTASFSLFWYNYFPFFLSWTTGVIYASDSMFTLNLWVLQCSV